MGAAKGTYDVGIVMIGMEAIYELLTSRSRLQSGGSSMLLVRVRPTMSDPESLA